LQSCKTAFETMKHVDMVCVAGIQREGRGRN